MEQMNSLYILGTILSLLKCPFPLLKQIYAILFLA